MPDMTRNAPRQTPRRYAVSNSRADIMSVMLMAPGQSVPDSMGPTSVQFGLAVHPFQGRHLSEHLEQLEFVLDPAGARILAQQLTDAADRAERIEGR